MNNTNLGPGSVVEVQCTDGTLHQAELCTLPMYDPKGEIVRGINKVIPTGQMHIRSDLNCPPKRCTPSTNSHFGVPLPLESSSRWPCKYALALGYCFDDFTPCVDLDLNKFVSYVLTWGSLFKDATSCSE